MVRSGEVTLECRCVRDILVSEGGRKKALTFGQCSILLCSILMIIVMGQV